MDNSNIDIRNGFYDREFTEVKKIRNEGYGEVFEVNKKSENKIYAVKKFNLGNQTKLKSLKEFQLFSILSEISSNDRRVVKYFDVWFERKENSNNDNMILFIQMELYEKSLLKIIEEIVNDPNLKGKNRLTPFGYYIASVIFLEIVRGVKSLHDQNPQIIHRNLNPESIHLTNKPNENLVRITNFGDATSHEFDGQSHTQNKGHYIYAAPEVLEGKKYDTRADIYSLGILQGKLFLVDINKYVTIYSEIITC
jgi:serine/threonine protein kinase